VSEITRFLPQDVRTPTGRIRKRTPVAVLDADFRGCQGWIFKYVGHDFYLVALHPALVNGVSHSYSRQIRVSRRWLGYAPGRFGPAQF